MTNAMEPPAGALDGVLKYHDAFDVPVLVRNGPARRPWPQWRYAKDPWPATGTIPAPGWYLVTALWRDVVKHGAEVGRDVVPWIRAVPQLTGQELLARISPLQAYLSLIGDFDRPHAHNAGRRLAPSIVYDHGTERSAKGAFGCRVGMTMAEWACRGLMGLGPTTHVESAQLPEFIVLAQSDGSAPDLCGRHRTDSSPLWLVEAKGRYKLGQPILKEGWEQLRQGSLRMADPHRLVLCGTSLHEHLFMTIDHVAHGHSDAAKASMQGGPDLEDHLGEDAEALLQTAQSQLLLYLHLRYGRGAGLRLVPLSPRHSAGVPARPGRLTPLEDDPATAEVRQRVRAMHPDDYGSMRRRREFVDFIVGSVGPTGVRLGMSRRLFAACERLLLERRQIMDLVDQSLGTAPGPHTALDRIPREAEEEVPLETWERILPEPEHLTRRVLAPREDLLPEEPAWVALERERFLHYQENEYQEHGRIRDEVRNAYWGAEEREWPQLLGGVEPGLDLDDDSLEAATAETYIAIQSSDPLLTTDAPR